MRLRRNPCEWPAMVIAIGPAKASTRRCTCVLRRFKRGDDPPHVLVSVDTIGLPGSMVREVTQQLEQRHGIVPTANCRGVHAYTFGTRPG